MCLSLVYILLPCFRNFGESVSTARRAGDADPDQAFIADTMKLLGNSGYGKTVTNIDRHRDVKYCTEVGTSALIQNKRFRQLEGVTDDAYEIELNKQVVKYTLPLHIGFFVYQYAKLRMLQFYCDFIDRYVERPLFQYCDMDTDSAYIALAGETIIPNTASITSATDPNGCRPNAATSTTTSTSRPDWLDARGRPLSRVVSRARRSTRGRPICSRWNGAGTDSLVCAASRTTASARLTSAARRV